MAKRTDDPTDRTRPERDPNIEMARARLQQLAIKLCARIHPLDVGGSYLAIGATLVAGQIGKDRAGEYLSELAAELVAEIEPGWGGNA